MTPIGIGVENYWKNLVAGKCGVEAITRFDTEELPVKIAAEVKDFNAEDFMPKKLTREMDVFMQYGYAKKNGSNRRCRRGNCCTGAHGYRRWHGTWRYFTDCRSAGWIKQGRT